jgi:hypothetical protein
VSISGGIDDLVVVADRGYLGFSSGVPSPQDGGFDLNERKLSVRQHETGADPESLRAEDLKG